ncbi:ABC transporter permease [Lentibacillus sp. L22]|uniref:ABC transporter permease n=1 Tax=Lentibacillus sp. L22 TaxID=3163028 RepID=UPI0022B16E33|nr:ABC transporter permease [Lentibacillus daqui]
MQTEPGNAPVQTKETDKISSPINDIWRVFRKNKLALVGAGILAFFILLALFAGMLAPEGIDDQKVNQPEELLHSPSGAYWLGTDEFGRDILSRVMYGARLSLWVGFSSVVGSVIVGVILGILAGYYGRWLDILISRIFDIMLAFPSILLAIAIVAMLGPSLQNALIAIALVNVPIFGRLIRSTVLSLKEEEYVEAARSIGMRDSRILFHHILPNSLAPIIVQGTLSIATAILDAAALGFLGLGAQPPDPEWGRMLADSRNLIQEAPWTVIFPGICIMLTVLGFNLVGDGLRDALDPKMKT